MADKKTNKQQTSARPSIRVSEDTFTLYSEAAASYAKSMGWKKVSNDQFMGILLQAYLRGERTLPITQGFNPHMRIGQVTLDAGAINLLKQNPNFHIAFGGLMEDDGTFAVDEAALVSNQYFLKDYKEKYYKNSSDHRDKQAVDKAMNKELETTLQEVLRVYMPIGEYETQDEYNNRINSAIDHIDHVLQDEGYAPKEAKQ